MEMLTPRRRAQREAFSQWNPSPSKTRSIPLTPQHPNVRRMRLWERKPMPSHDPARKGKKIMKRPFVKETSEEADENVRGDGCWVLSTPDRNAQKENATGKRRMIGDLVGPIPAHWNKTVSSQETLDLQVDTAQIVGTEIARSRRKRNANGKLVVRPDDIQQEAVSTLGSQVDALASETEEGNDSDDHSTGADSTQDDDASAFHEQSQFCEDMDEDSNAGSTDSSGMEDASHVQTESPGAGRCISAASDSNVHEDSNVSLNTPVRTTSSQVAKNLEASQEDVMDLDSSEITRGSKQSNQFAETSPESSDSSGLEINDDTIDVARYLREDTLTVDVHASSSSPHMNASADEKMLSRRQGAEDDDFDCSYGSEFFTDSVLDNSAVELDEDDMSEGSPVKSPGDTTMTFNTPFGFNPLSPVRARLEMEAQCSPFFGQAKGESHLSRTKFNFSPALQRQLSPGKVALPPAPRQDLSPSKIPLPPSPAVIQPEEGSEVESESEEPKVDTENSENEINKSQPGSQGRKLEQDTAHDEETASLLSFLDRVRNSRAARLTTDASKLMLNEASTFIRASLSPEKETTEAEPMGLFKSSGALRTNDSTPTKKSRNPSSGSKDARSSSDDRRAKNSDMPASPVIRRSRRTQANSSSTKQSKSISVRPTHRRDGQDTNVPPKSAAQELASLTRANTQRNRGNREKTAKVISSLVFTKTEINIIKPNSPDATKAGAEGADANGTRPKKSVVWDEVLVYFRPGDSPPVPKQPDPAPSTAEDTKAIEAQLSAEIIAASPVKPLEPEQVVITSPSKLQRNGTKAPAKKPPKGGRVNTRSTPARRRSSLSLALLAEDTFAGVPASAAPPVLTGPIQLPPSSDPAPAEQATIPAVRTSPRRKTAARPKTVESGTKPASADEPTAPVVAPATREIAKPRTRSRLPAPSSGAAAGSGAVLKKKAVPEVAKRAVGGTPAKRRGRS